MTQIALDDFSITRSARDPRSDGATRTVHLNRSSATIDRTVAGVRMRVGVPVSSYLRLVISVQSPLGRATLTLRHTDAELDVVIGTGEALDVARSARAWSSVLHKPVEVEEAGVRLGTAFARQRKRAKPSRRPQFARRRKPGMLDRLQTRFAGEREIIART